MNPDRREFLLTLHARAMALQDDGSRRAVIVTLDVLGPTAPVVARSLAP